MKKKKHPITTNYKKIRLYLKEGRIKEAEELLNWGIARLANVSIEGIKIIDKVDVDLWKDRYWFERLSRQKSDTEVAQAIITAIRWNNIIDENKIKVKVESGWVTLEGEVEWSFEKNAIEHTVENLIGVRGVSNLITISSKLKTNDIKQKITAAFHRSATLDANNIIVDSVGNTVILRGVVRSYAEKQDALRVAWNAPGVTKVDNKLIVDVPMLVS